MENFLFEIPFITLLFKAVWPPPRVTDWFFYSDWLWGRRASLPDSVHQQEKFLCTGVHRQNKFCAPVCTVKKKKKSAPVCTGKKGHCQKILCGLCDPHFFCISPAFPPHFPTFFIAFLPLGFHRHMFFFFLAQDRGPHHMIRKWVLVVANCQKMGFLHWPAFFILLQDVPSSHRCVILLLVHVQKHCYDVSFFVQLDLVNSMMVAFIKSSG